jgi:hypothetical protein
MRHLPALLLSSFFPCLLTSAGLLGQSIVFPSTHANIPDGSSSIYWFPFSSGISRAQIVYEDWDLNVPANTPITRIGFRQDAVGGALPSRLLQLEVRIGTTTATATTIGSNFDANFAAAPTIVHPQSLYTLPALVPASPGIVWVNFTTPYLYPGGNLLVEFRVYANNNGNQAFPYYLDLGGFVSPVASGVPGCPHSGNQVPLLASYPTQVGTNWTMQLSQAPASTAMALFVAPGQPMSAPYGLQALGLAPACNGQLPLLGLVSLGALTTTNGYANWSIPIPGGLAFNNFVISSQAVILDAFVPGGLVVSNADQIQFGITPPEAIVWSQGNATAATGIVYTDQGVVTFFN